MRILLFHGDLDSLNHFTDIAKNFLEAVGCKTHVCKITMPLSNRETDLLADFLEKRVVLVRKCVGKTILPLNGLFLYLYCYGNNLRLSPSILPPSAA